MNTIKVTSISVSKKGKTWIQAEVVSGEVKVGQEYRIMDHDSSCPECGGNPLHLSSYTKNGESHICGCRTCKNPEVIDE